MSKVKILHCADIHIGAAFGFLGEKAESRRFETLITFEKIVDSAAQNGVQAVAVAGDLFDSNSVEPVFVTKALEKIAMFPEIKFIFAAGNHDPLNFLSPLKKVKLPDNFYVLDTTDQSITFEDIKLKVYGRSFESAFLKGEAEFGIHPDSNYVNLMVLHGELKSDLNSRYNSVTRRFIENSGMDYIALGHIHKRTDIGKIGKTYFSYCGCPEGQGFDETDQKGVYIGEIGENECTLEFVPTAKRMHIIEEADITEAGGTGGICELIANTLCEKYGDCYGENLYKIILIGEVAPEAQISVSEIRSRIADKVYFVKVEDKTHIAYDFEALSKEVSLKGFFVKNMLAEIAKAPQDQKELLINALNLGLKAFCGEVAYNED